jgi:hypothetical protein
MLPCDEEYEIYFNDFEILYLYSRFSAISGPSLLITRVILN